MFFFSFWPQCFHTILSIYCALFVLWCPIHLFYFAKNRDVQASSRIAGKSHGYQPARCKLVIERNQPGPGVHEVLLDHQLVAVGIVFPTSHLQPTHLVTWDFEAGKISQKKFHLKSKSLGEKKPGCDIGIVTSAGFYIIWCFVDLYSRFKQAEIMRNWWILLTGRERCCRLVASWVSSAKPRPSGTSGWCSSDLRDSL